MDTAKIHDWHKPLNEECEQNQDIEKNCTCKRVRHYKSYRVVRVRDEDVTMHKVKKDFTVELHPNGRLLIRETGRSKGSAMITQIGKIYENALWHEMMVKARMKKQKKKKR